MIFINSAKLAPMEMYEGDRLVLFQGMPLLIDGDPITCKQWVHNDGYMSLSWVFKKFPEHFPLFDVYCKSMTTREDMTAWSW